MRTSSAAFSLLLSHLLIFNLLGESLGPASGAKPAYEPAQNGMRPVWGGGVFVKIENNESPSPEIQTFDEQGRLLLSATFQIPNATLVHIRGFARAGDGALAVGGFSNADDGRMAAFFSWIAPDGKTANVTRCEPFYPVKMAIASDGTLWTVGYINPHSAVRDTDPNAGVIRHFDRAGRLIESFIPRTSVRDAARIPSGHLAASAGGVGWISAGAFSPGKALPGAYIEIAPDGALKEYPLPPTMVDETANVFGFALTDAGSAFANVETGEGSARKHTLFALDRSRGTWEPVSVPGVSSLVGSWLYGASANTLAFTFADSARIRLFEVAK
jgi:hypothetical protein